MEKQFLVAVNEDRKVNDGLLTGDIMVNYPLEGAKIQYV